MTNAATTPPTEHPLWARARAMFARAVAAIGAPAVLAAMKLISEERRREIVAWLCPLEHIVRKLLFAEACEIRRAERFESSRGPRLVHIPLRSPGRTAGLQARTCSTVARQCAPEGARSNLDASQPETWRASFSFAVPHDPNCVPDSRAPRIRALWGLAPPPPTPVQRAPRVFNAADTPLSLARRLEALRRVLDEPLAYAKRLADLLAGVARRFPGAAKRYVFAPARTCDYDPKDDRLAIEAIGAAIARWDAFDSS